jgi:hypothetical protein
MTRAHVWRLAITRVFVLVALPLIAGVTLMACGQSVSSAQRSVNKTEIDRIKSSLSQQPGVAFVTTAYGGTAESADVQVYLHVNAGADVDALRDEAVREVWHSRIRPLDGIAIDMSDESNNRHSIAGIAYGIPADSKRLEAKYGRRPVSST